MCAISEQAVPSIKAPIRYVFEPVPGLGNARNAGVEATSADLGNRVYR